MHNAEAAAAELRRGIELDPSPAVFHVNLAIALIVLQQPGEAEVTGAQSC
jgi:hypothetical protein